MSFLKFYLILTALGILLDVIGIILGYSQGTVEQMAFCFVASVILLIIGIRGIVGKLKAYM